MRISSFLLLIAFFLLGTSSSSGTEQNRQLQEYIKQARTTHPDLQAMRSMVDAERSRAKMKSGWMNPMFRVGAMNVPSKTLAFDEDPMTMLQTGIMQRIPFPGQIKRRATVGNEQVATRELEWEVEANTMARMIRMAYYETAASQTTLDLLEHGIELFKPARDAASGMTASGMGNTADILSIDAERSDWLRKIQAAASIQKKKQSELAETMGLDPDSVVAIDPLPDSLPLLPPLESLLSEDALVTAPELLLAAQRLKESKASLRLAERSYLTDLDVMFAYGYRFPLKMTSSSVSHTGETVLENTTVPQDPMLSLEVSFPLPVFANRNQKAMIGEERSMSKSRVSELASVQLNLQQELIGEHAELQRTIAEATTLRQVIIPAREAAYQQLLSGYRSGNIQLMQVIDAQMKWIMAQMDESMLRADSWARYGNLFERIGK